jgi:multicomponent Na+:H+ antiporter subunit D
MPILVVVIPLLSAMAVSMVGWFWRQLCWPMTVVALGATLAATLATLGQVMRGGTIHYQLGGWPPPIGIEYVIDHLNGLILVTIAGVAFLAAIFAKESVARELPGKTSFFYTIFILLVTGLLGMTITGDAFNLYVLLEIAALTGYALVAAGGDRALVASFNYLLLGTIGASFYLLGVGHLYIMTGSLNMGDLLTLLPGLFPSQAIFVAFVLILTGIWLKMAFFPLHGWLPNAYSQAPSAAACLMAPLVTKVSVYVMIRLMFSVFSVAYVFQWLHLADGVVWLAVLAIIAGSLMALAQTDFKRMLSYLIVAEVGYMVGGVWLANTTGLTGAILHIVNDAMMTLCLFLVAGIVVYKTGSSKIEALRGLYGRMPLTMAAFTVGALSMIGVPPTAGFFSKWYLILGAIESGSYHFMVALLFSSLVNVILFFRVIEVAYFTKPAAADDSSVQHGPVLIDEPPLTMLVPLLITAVLLIVVGIYAGDLVRAIIQPALPAGI